MSENHDVGKFGESLAEDFLVYSGYKILKRNFHFGKIAEIDIIAKDNDEVAFIEVKTRNNEKYGDALYSITPKKQKSIRKAAEGWIYVNKADYLSYRFDVIIVDTRTTPAHINHLKNAF